MDYPKEQLWELYKNIPEELQKAVFSEEVANKIYSACAKNNIKGEKIKEVSKHIGFVLLGIIAPSEFQETLEKEVKLDKKTSQKVFEEINSSVFFPLRKNLEALYGAEIPEPVNTETPPLADKDRYREPIE